MKVLLLQYNNYFNRKVKKETTYTAYEAYKVAEILNLNFKKGNGINTTQIVNMDTAVVPDYLIYAKDDGTIVSRWFVIEADETREGQFTLTLRRDVIADNLELVKEAPAFIEKAKLKNDDPLIFNSENMTFNQIKTDEKMLKDKTETPWIVGYFSNTVLGDGADVVETKVPITYDLSYASWSDYPYFSYFTTPAIIDVSNVRAKIPILSNETSYQGQVRNIYRVIYGTSGIESNTNTGLTSTSTSALRYNGSSYLTSDIIMERALAGIKNNTTSSLTTASKSEYVTPVSVQTALAQQAGKIIRLGTSESNYQYFRISGSLYGSTQTHTVNTSSNLFTTIKATTQNNEYLDGFLQSAEVVQFEQNYKLTAQEITPTLRTTMMAGRQTLSDAPYCMFCMPYNAIKIDSYTFSSDTYRRIASAITEKYSGTHLYDIQLLPYCPFDYTVNGTNIITPATVQKQPIQKISGSETTFSGNIYWCNKSSFTRDIALSIPSTDPKIESQTEFIRLQSPNYNGSFDFIPAKNNGINSFNVDATYKPYTPYIHVSPNFKGLYGSDFNDARGLICSGDFSLPNVSDQFATYELNNKNYQNTFDRQIQSMDMKANYAKTQDIIGAISGAIGGGASVAGGIGMGLNSIGGGIIGGTIAGVASLGAGLADVAINDKLRREDINLTKDLFGYNLGNIQARADTINKVGVLNENFKFFPFVEFYSATDEEKNALRAKIKYNGMSVGVISTIGNYLWDDETFIKAQIIRADNIKDDFIMMKEISNELNKGVYIKK